jgi:uracil-DNA glycosylase
MNGTAFFPGGDGLWKPLPGDDLAFPIGGALILGSDFGDVVWYDTQFEHDVAYRQEIGGATWRGLLKLVDLAGILRTELFCTNGWPCLREGNDSVKGGIPGARDRDFTARCVDFFRFTLKQMRPAIIVPLGLAPTAFVAMLEPSALAYWFGARSWREVDRMPIGHLGEISVVPVVHPSMPNRRHRAVAKTIEQEAELLRDAIRRIGALRP